ncbi:unnamed protein product [Effrenium voratum]|uniref:Uncharacterized protein n=1 Tax=Effrenium voratum TaxID=2562239 RepID=A0AA36I2W9_9DINO|nr:unnamed protein product [Effrenium voratum]
MPPLYPSPGPFPSHQALAAVDKDQVRKAYYETTSSRALPGREVSEEIRGENFLNVHCIGQRNTRYLQWTRNFAPLTTRVACHHTKTYVPLPLGDNKINMDLAKSFKSGWQQSKGGSSAAMDGCSMYEGHFVGCSAKELQNARQPSRKPPQTLTHTVCPAGALLELQSHEHRRFAAPSGPGLRSQRVKPPRPNLEMGGAAVDPAKRR